MEPVVCLAGLAAGGGAGLEQQQPQVANESHIPVAWLEGEVLAEYVKFLEEAAAQPGGVEWAEEQAREEFSRFLMDVEEFTGDYGGGDWGEVARFIEGTVAGQAPEHGGIDDCGSCVVDGNVGDSLIEDEELEMLVPHILDLPAFRAREAAAQQETEQPSPRQGGGWMQLFS